MKEIKLQQDPIQIVASQCVAGFATDCEISNGGVEWNLIGRELYSVSEYWLDPLKKPETLAEMFHNEKGHDEWNQFRTYTQMTGQIANFDQEWYTTKLDESKISKELEEKAIKLAGEIARDDRKCPY